MRNCFDHDDSSPPKAKLATVTTSAAHAAAIRQHKNCISSVMARITSCTDVWRNEPSANPKTPPGRPKAAKKFRAINRQRIEYGQLPRARTTVGRRFSPQNEKLGKRQERDNRGAHDLGHMMQKKRIQHHGDHERDSRV